MSVMSRFRRPGSAVVVVLGIAAFTVKGSSRPPEIDPGRPECPHNWDTIPRPKEQSRERITVPSPLTHSNGNAIAGPHTNVPEYNDCQRVILSDGTYGPLMAVFASYQLDSLVRDSGYIDAAGNQMIRAGTTSTVLAAAAVFNYSLSFRYPPLGIGPYYNCLFVWGYAHSYHAKMVQVKAADQNCAGPVLPDTLAGMSLTVIDRQAGPFDRSSDYPAVARWDWDSAHKIQYIGIKCGAAWCEVGPNGGSGHFSPSDPYINLSPTAPKTGANRVRAIKGWYDEQLLSIQTGTGKASPTRLLGTVIPVDTLGSYTESSFTAQWRVVSHVALRRSADPRLTSIFKVYKAKFNFDPVSPSADLRQMSEIAFCLGTAADCTIPPTPNASLARSCKSTLAAVTSPSAPPRWWSRTTSSLDGTALYRCVTRRDHSEMDVAPTSRWRWLALDETTWEDCIRGCCEVDGGT
jgi:hypothetical protein